MSFCGSSACNDFSSVTLAIATPSMIECGMYSLYTHSYYIRVARYMNLYMQLAIANYTTIMTAIICFCIVMVADEIVWLCLFCMTMTNKLRYTYVHMYVCLYTTW